MIPVSPVQPICSTCALKGAVEKVAARQSRTGAERRGDDSRTLVIALGNPYCGDDGVGPAILDRLRRLGGVYATVELLDDIRSELDILLLMKGCRRIFIIDAADLGLAPGEWRQLPRQALRTDGLRHLTAHQCDLAQVLEMSDVLGLTPPDVLIVAIQPASLDGAQRLTPAVDAAADQVCGYLAGRLTERPIDSACGEFVQEDYERWHAY
jgi:hydrogenase maturation protease